jgi:periplasmic protein TonB
MRSYAAQKAPGRSAFGFAVVVALHALLIWALLNGLGRKMVDVIKGPLVTKIIAAPKPPPETTPPPPPPKLVTPPPPYIPPPQVNVETPPSANAISAPVSNTPPPAVSAFKPAPAPAPVAVPDSDVAPVAVDGSKPEYPERLIDDEIEGSATITCTVDVDGTTSDCETTGVTGSSLFGSTALEFAKTKKFRPAIHNGVPVKTRAILPFTFKLTDK